MISLKNIEKYLLIFLLVSFSLIAFQRRIIFGFVCYDIDEFMIQFQEYLSLGYYDKVSDGTSIIHNVLLSFINLFIKDIQMVFYWLNVFSQLAISIIGVKILILDKKQNKWLVILFSIYWCLLWVNDEQHGLSRNDLLLGVFMMLTYYFLFNQKISINCKSILVGIFIALALSTREITIIFLPAVVFYILSNFKEYKVKFLLMTAISFVVITGVLHYPSLKENNKISFYDKNKNLNSKGFNWNDINTLATLRMFDESKVEVINKNMYWGWNGEKVKKYKKQYNITKSPTNSVSFFFKYPLYYLKLLSLNLLNILIFTFRRYSLFIFYPLILLILSYRNKSLSLDQKRAINMFGMFIITTFCLLFSINTIIEVRWLISIEILLFYSIFLSYKSIVSLYPNKIRILNVVSFSILILFNLRTIINTI